MILIRGGCDAMRVDEQRLAGVAIPGGPPGLHGRSLWEEARSRYRSMLRQASARQHFDAIKDSESNHRIVEPVRSTRCRTPRRSPISRSLARVDAKKRPSNRSPRSRSSRFCQLWALHPTTR